MGAVPYEVTERALATQAQKLKETGADTLILYPTPTHGALILKEMAKLGYKPKVVVCFTLGDPIMFNIAGADVWEGVYPASSGQLRCPRGKGSGRVIEILKKYDPKLAGKEYLAVFGATSMMYLVEGLKNAGKEPDPGDHDQGHGDDQELETGRNRGPGDLLSRTAITGSTVPG